ncbi:hypothetical protein ABW21_db0209169 [Orbilia brochopaga]|nr:hypothetical protein ABW21_db0209169 [Drechslerella brochopaga]
MAQRVTGQKRLSLALDDFQKQLTPTERTNLGQILQPDVTTVTTFAAQINGNSNLRRKKLGDKIQPFLLFMQSFGDVVGIYIQSDPRVSALVWGSIKLVVQTSGSLKCRTMLLSLLKQLAILSQPMTADLQDTLEDAFMRNHFPPDIHKIEALFIMLAQELSSVYLFVDGVDECTAGDRIDLLSCFGRLLKAKTDGINIALSSRPEVDIPRTLKIAHEISLEAMTQRPDLEVYIADELDTKCVNLHGCSAELKEEIKAALLRGADGM